MKLSQLFENSNDNYDYFDIDGGNLDNLAYMFVYLWSRSSDWTRKNYDDKETLRQFQVAYERGPAQAGIKLYRGFHFQTEAERDEFRKQIQTGRLVDKAFSAWTDKIKLASQFALLDEWAHPDDGLSGFVVSMIPPRGTRIIDCSKFNQKYYDFNDEFIVDAGTFKIKIERSYDD